MLRSSPGEWLQRATEEMQALLRYSLGELPKAVDALCTRLGILEQQIEHDFAQTENGGAFGDSLLYPLLSIFGIARDQKSLGLDKI
jgi:hypothetical protein